MTQIITAFFDKRSDATEAVGELVEAGIPRASVRIMPDTDVAPSREGSYDYQRDEKGFWASLSELFFPEEDRYTYAEAMHRGNIMVTATVDDDDAETAADILEEHGTINMDDTEQKWRSSGWSGYSENAMGGSSDMNEGRREESIPIVEEELQIGKRQVESGRVKVRSYVVEQPVSESVSLREETVRVERRPAERSIAAGEDAFRERTIEARAVSEEAVVAKNARVTGEVVVKKGVEQRNETVSDTVRRTEVDVDEETENTTPRRTARR